MWLSNPTRSSIKRKQRIRSLTQPCLVCLKPRSCKRLSQWTTFLRSDSQTTRVRRVNRKLSVTLSKRMCTSKARSRVLRGSRPSDSMRSVAVVSRSRAKEIKRSAIRVTAQLRNPDGAAQSTQAHWITHWITMTISSVDTYLVANQTALKHAGSWQLSLMEE